MCLASECKRKQIRKPPSLNAWCDLRLVYSKFYSRRPAGLNGALQDLGIAFEGREHSGICDARNTASLAWRLLGDGCRVAITKHTIGFPLHPDLKDAPLSVKQGSISAAVSS